MRWKAARTFYALVAAATLGCAGAKIVGQAQSVPLAGGRLAQIVVYPFSVSASDVTLNQSFGQRTYRQVSGGDENSQQLQLAHDTAHNVCVQVAANLSRKGYTATCLDRGVPPAGDNVLIVDGEFNDINEGNRLRRMVIGLETGQSAIDATVKVAHRNGDASQQLMQFATHADSGSMPGAAIMGSPGAAAGGAAAAASLGVNVAAGGAKNFRSSTGSLAEMTADQIVEQITKYYTEQGWTGAS